MDYASIPGIDLRASRIGLGTWAIGGWMWDGTDEDLRRSAAASLQTAAEAPIGDTTSFGSPRDRA
jgi:aryl-alcohol dehydrogenase-like predicted oxidoreductase